MSMLADRNEFSVGEVVPESLKFEAGQKSSVITQRNTVRYYPTTGQQIKSSEGNKITIFRLSSSDFLDPRTAMLHFRLSVGNYKARIEDLLTSLIQSVTLQIGGVECEHIDNFGEAYKMLAYASCPKHVYDNNWAATMGAYKYRQCQRANVYHGAGAVLDVSGDISGGHATEKFVMGQIYDYTSYPMADRENDYGVVNPDGKKGKYVAIPLAELLGVFKMKQLIPMTFLGSVDITINWATFEKACINAKGYNRDPVTGIMTLEGADLGAADRYYQLDDLTVSTDLCSLDKTYLSLVTGLVSSSPQGLTMPFESLATSTRGFQNGGQSSIYVSKGVSYIKKLFWSLRCQKHVANEWVDKSQFKFADAFKAYQLEIGSRLFPENRVTDLASAYVELTKATDSIGNIDQGGICNNENYLLKTNGFVTGHAYTPALDIAAPVAAPHRETPQAFIMGQNLEKAMGSGTLSGLSLKLSGYSIHLQLDLKTTPDTSPVNKFLEPNADLFSNNAQLNLLTVMVHDKAIVLRQDAITVSE